MRDLVVLEKIHIFLALLQGRTNGPRTKMIIISIVDEQSAN